MGAVRLYTIVFTDVANSSATKRDIAYGNDSQERDKAYLESVQVPHFELVRECCSTYAGKEVSTIGDAFYLIFEEPVQAIRCAVAIQRQLAATPIKTPLGTLHLRIGLHTGSPQPFEGGWHGTDVDTAARIESTACEDQILISSATYELVRNISDLTFHRAGDFALRGIERVTLWEVDWNNHGPRSCARRALSTDLDIPPSVAGFVGRSTESNDLERLLATKPMVAIEGLSGVGKTSLVLKVADAWTQKGLIDPHGLFYFDCSQRSMRLNGAGEALLNSLASFWAQAGLPNEAATIGNERAPAHQRRNALSAGLLAGLHFLFLDNVQDALDEHGWIASESFSNLLKFMSTRPLGKSRVVLASYVQLSAPGAANLPTYRVRPLSSTDARLLLTSLGFSSSALADRITNMVGGHPQALRWFSVLPQHLGLSVEELLNDLTATVDASPVDDEFQRRIGRELLNRVWRTLPAGAQVLLSRAMVYRRSVPFGAFAAVAPFADVSRWRQTLLDRFLVDASEREAPHSVHALVREFAQRQLDHLSEEWRDAHRAAAAWWRGHELALLSGSSDSIKAAIEEHFHLVSAGDAVAASDLAERLRPILRTAGYESRRKGLIQETESIFRAFVETSPLDPQAHFLLATSLHGRAKQDESEKHLVLALALNPDHVPARIAYAAYLDRIDEPKRAEQEFKKALAAPGNKSRALSALALFLEKHNRPAEARESHEAAIAENPQNVGARLAFGLFLWRNDCDTEAESAFMSGISIAPFDPKIRSAYARFLHEHSRLDAALSQIQTAVELQPNDVKLRVGYSRLLTAKGRIKDADAQLVTALRNHAERSTVRPLALLKRYAQFVAQYLTPTEAEARLIAELASHPSDFRIGLEYAKFLAAQGRMTEAEVEYKRILSAKVVPKVVASFSKFLITRGRGEDAMSQLEVGLAINPFNRQLLGLKKRLAVFLSRGGHPDSPLANPPQGLNFSSAFLWRNTTPEQRIATCESILAIDSKDYAANYVMARTLAEYLKNLARAEPYFRQALSLKPNNIDLRLRWARLLDRTSRSSEALSVLREILPKRPQHPEVHNQMGNCFKNLEQWSQAEAAYKTAVGLTEGANRAKYLNNLALLFLAWPDRTRLAEAVGLCSEALNLNPAFAWIKDTEARIVTRLSGTT